MENLTTQNQEYSLNYFLTNASDISEIFGIIFCCCEGALFFLVSKNYHDFPSINSTKKSWWHIFVRLKLIHVVIL